MSHASLIVLWLRRIILGGIVVLMLSPLLVLDGLLFGAVFPKAVLFQMVVEILLAIWVALAILDPSVRPPLRHPLVIAVLAFTAFALLSPLWSLDPERAFWSTRHRMMGSLGYAHYAAFFLMLVSTVRTQADWRRLVSGSLVVAAIVAVLGVFEAISTGSTMFRVESTFGNASYLAGYLMLHVFLALWVRSTVESKLVRRGSIAVIGLFALTMFLTASRGPLLGLVIGVGLAVGVWGVIKFRPGQRIVVLSFSAILLAAAIGGALYVRTPEVRASVEPALPWFVARMVYADPGADRLAFWSVARGAIWDRPILGWGLGSFETVFNFSFDPSGEHGVVKEAWFDRAHNQFLDIWLALGTVGFLVYLSIWVACVGVLVFRLSRATGANERLGFLALLGAVAAYAIHIFFSFDMIGPVMIWYVLLALAVVLTSDAEMKKSKLGSVRMAIAAGVVLLLVQIPLQWQANLLPFWKSTESYRGYQILAQDREVAFQAFQASLASPNWADHEIRLWLVDLEAPVIEQFSHRSEGIERISFFVSDEMAKSEAARSEDYRTLAVAAEAHRLAAQFDESYLEQATQSANAAIAINPHRSEAYEQLGEVALLHDDVSEADRLQSQALTLAVDSYLYHGRIQMRLAEIAVRLGEYDRAFAYIDAARASGFEVRGDTRIATAMGELVTDAAEFPRTIEYVDSVLLAFPNNAAALTAAIRLHARADDTLFANTLLDTLEQKEPELSEALRAEVGL